MEQIETLHGKYENTVGMSAAATPGNHNHSPDSQGFELDQIVNRLEITRHTVGI